MSKIKIAIDAGHGSNTAGKRTPDGYKEHYANVKCAKFFDEAMKRCGFATVKTGWDDTNSKDDPDTSLTARQRTIKASGAKASVSFHFNAFGANWNAAQGVETLIHSTQSRRADSKALADKVQKQLIKGTKQKNRGVKTQILAMCNCAAMGTKASILIEGGFMTNDYEAKLMKSDAFCKEIAEETAKGVCDYFNVAYIPEESKKPAKPSVKPSDPVIQKKEIYRIRKTWFDDRTQIGAYRSLEKAKKACIKGYTVYNSAGKAVYTNKPASTSKPVAYYAKYTGKSAQIDVVLKAIGVPEKYRGKWSKRKPLAEKNGIKNYDGDSHDNLKMISLAKSGKLKKV